jgi:hypothetical protein
MENNDESKPILRYNEVYPDNIVYIKDSETNRRVLTEKLGPSKISLDVFHEYVYLEVNTLTKEWRPTFAFAWLYRNQPPLVSTDALDNLLIVDELVEKREKQKESADTKIKDSIALFKYGEKMRALLKKWHDLGMESDMRPEDECMELLHETGELLKEIEKS